MNQRTGLLLSAVLTAIGVIGVVALFVKGHGAMGTTHQFPCEFSFPPTSILC